MCRIAGLIADKPISDNDKAIIEQMCRVQAHGGPDDEGIFVDADAGVILGHRRLSIIDLSKNGHQPMSDLSGSAWITFNGEIYNYLQLRDELVAAGAIFRSQTDTEVILQAYLRWGMAAFSKLRGIFAFALIDQRRQLTYLVRDSAGIKPLYYFVAHGRLVFASEVKAFEASGITNAADPHWQIRFLAFGHIPEPYTTLKDVRSLPKGEYLCWDNQKRTYVIHPYHVIRSVNYVTSRDLAKKALRESLSAAVERQLISDAPIGVFLSGGVDSSLLTLLSSRAQKSKLKTISICFEEKSYDESAYQHLITNKIEGEKFRHLVRQGDFDDLFPRILDAMDMPTTDGINTWFISKFAHDDGLKAVLSGIGADELFGGYPSFNRIRYLKNAKRLPTGMLKAAGYLLNDQYKKMSYVSYEHPLADYLLLRGLFLPAAITEILDTTTSEVEDVLFSGRNLPYLKNYDATEAAWFETNLYMQNQLLRDTDVMGMSHGLEIRLPFLDEDFRELTEHIDPLVRFDRERPKKILIDSFSDLLPRDIWNRSKMGFTFPLQEWMRVNPGICDGSNYHGKIRKNIVKAFRENRVHWSKAFALFQIQLNE